MEKLRVGFIVTSGKYNYKPFRNQPLNVLYLLTILEEKFGDRVKLSLIDLRGVEEESVSFHIQENDVFMYTITTLDYKETAYIVKSLRSLYPDAKHIAGGPHVTIFPMESSEVFDTVVIGEGEESIIKIIDDICALDLKPYYRQNKVVDINNYPVANRKYIPKKAVADTRLLNKEYLGLLGTSVLFSRGCPYNCHFCSNLNFGPVRFRSAKLIEEEIEYLKKVYKIEAIALKDDNSIPIGRKHAQPFLEAIGRTCVKWRGQSRANGVDKDMVKLAKEAGCVELAVGVERVSPEALKIINKKLNLDESKSYLRLLRESGIDVRIHFILGLPGEPDDIVRRTLEFINEVEPNSVLLTLLCPLPGTEIYNNPEQYGIKYISKDWDKYILVFGRFSDNEIPELVFEYKDITPWGSGMSKEKIVANYMELQSILRERKLNF